MATFFVELRLIENGRLESVYLLNGGDFYLEEEAINSLCEAFYKEGSAERLVFYGNGDNDDTFIQSLLSVGIFSLRQVVIYKQIGKLPVSYRKTLLTYLKKPDVNILLIMVHDGQKGGSFLNDLKRLVHVIPTWTPRTEKFPDFILRALTKNGIDISADALELLVDSTNDSLSHAFSELEKVIVFIGERKTISIKDVRKVVGGSKDFRMSDFIDAVCQRNLKSALIIFKALIETGANTPYFVSSLYNFFFNVWAYPDVHKKKREEVFYKKKQIAKYRAGYGNYSDSDFGHIFRMLTDVDLKSKSVNLSTEDLMVPLLYEIIGKQNDKDGK